MRVWKTRMLRELNAGNDGPAYVVSGKNTLPFMLYSAKESGFFLPCPKNLGKAECKVTDEAIWRKKSQNRVALRRFHGYLGRWIAREEATRRGRFKKKCVVRQEKTQEWFGVVDNVVEKKQL